MDAIPTKVLRTLPTAPHSSAEGQNRKLVEFDSKFEKIRHLFDTSVIGKHLTFMKAIYSAAHSADNNFTVEDESTGIKSPSPPLRVYLSKAVYRYHIWITRCLPGRSEHGPLAKHEIPPLDVLAILHAHMLAPSRFNEDILLHFRELGLIGRFPFDHIVRIFFPVFSC
jgi:hypothetical protein